MCSKGSNGYSHMPNVESNDSFHDTQNASGDLRGVAGGDGKLWCL